MTEREVRAEFLNTLLTTPHRNLAALQTDHEQMIKQDPRFYVHLAAWYADEGQVRDHKEMFVIMLCLSDFEGHREVGLALLRRLPPYEVARVIDYIKGRTITRRRRVEPRRRVRRRPRVPRRPRPAQRPIRERGFLRRILNRRNQPAAAPPQIPEPPVAVPAVPEPAEPEPRYVVEKEEIGMSRNVPRSMRTEIERYLREREADDNWFDRTVLTARKPMKRLYGGLHIRPSDRAQAVLFDDKPPADSLAFKVKQIAKAETPAEQARAIAKYQIPYRVASSVILDMTPMVLAALIDVMTPQEVINNIASLKRRGALDNPDIKALVDEKLKSARKDKRVSAYKAKVAVQAAGATGELADALDDVTEAQIKQAGAITRKTALLIDKSGSMQVAIEVGKQLGAMVSAICEAELHTFAFDTVSYAIEPKGSSLADWEAALAGINARGGTSCGVTIDWMRRKKILVEQIVMVTDEDENTAPTFVKAYEEYAKKMGIRPAVILVRVGRAVTKLQIGCAKLGIAPNVFTFGGDYYALPNVIPFLTYPSLTDLVMEILEYPLPQRRLA